MNTPDNRRRKDSKRRLEQALVSLLKRQDISQITVTDLCREAQVNRSTFYSNYEDIYQLADGLQRQLAQDLLSSFQPLSQGAGYEDRCILALFTMIRDNRLLFRACFKLGIDHFDPQWALDLNNAHRRYDDRYLDYHVVFFRAGLNAIIRHWLDGNCTQSPEELLYILHQEYGLSTPLASPLPL